jgi:hypothetical protein
MTPQRYLIRVNDRVLGPHSLEALQQMASMQAFDETALISPEGTEQWSVLRDSPELRASFFPSARKFQFKDKPFTAVNKPTNEPISVEEMLRGNIAKAQPFEPTVVAERPRPNRRRQDFVTAIIFGYAVIGLIVWWAPRSSFVYVGAVSLGAVYTVGLYWVLYHVMDRY